MTEYEMMAEMTKDATSAGQPEISPEATIGSLSQILDWLISSGQPLEVSGLVSFMKSTTAGKVPVPSGFSVPTTNQIVIQREVEILEAAARTENRELFSRWLRLMELTDKPPEDYVRIIQLCLGLEMHSRARKIALEGAEKFQNDVDLQKLARLLGPAKVINPDLPPDPNAAANMQWLRQHADEYHGKFVAVKGGELLAVASSYKELFEIVGPVKGKGILVTQVF